MDLKYRIVSLLILFFLGAEIFPGLIAQNHILKAQMSIKTPGNQSETYDLTPRAVDEGEKFYYETEREAPFIVIGTTRDVGDKVEYSLSITALEDIYFNFKQNIRVGKANHENCKFLLPGFWYRKNLRSPEEAPSFHTSDSWMVREDRLSAPLTGIFDKTTDRYFTIMRSDEINKIALTPHEEGEVILSGENDLGFTGFENVDGKATLAIGYPYREAPKTYISKLKLAPPVTSFSKLEKGDTQNLNWVLNQGEAADFADFVAQTWTRTYDYFEPQCVELKYTIEFFKKTLTNFYSESYVETEDLNYFSGVHLRTEDCKDQGSAEIGFVGRVLLNAYFALKYAEKNDDVRLKGIARSVLDSYLENGFNKSGFFREFVNYKNNNEPDVFSIRRQSEGVFAILKYLDYEKNQGRSHPQWEEKIEKLLGNFLKLQKDDGSFPRKFKGNFELVDATGGSTPSATLPLVMAFKYFNNKEYLESAEKSGKYLETELISKSDYFSSTLDANCEDKEASLYAATAMYYLALSSDGEKHDHYIDLAKKASYFALSWYYLWDVPFAQGQMLGDIGLKSRGWGNVSVENNHIDVFIFEFVDVLNFLAKETAEERFSEFGDVIETSMLQLLPYPGHMCGIGKTGFYPEVIQHTNWDYGHNGKGFYNTIFAPGWTVASLWTLLNPRSADKFIRD